MKMFNRILSKPSSLTRWVRREFVQNRFGSYPHEPNLGFSQISSYPDNQILGLERTLIVPTIVI